MQLNPSTDYYNDEDNIYPDVYNVDKKNERDTLPEPKKLIQPFINNKKISYDDDEDVEYDKDDEHIEIDVGRPKRLKSRLDNDFFITEGSGGLTNKRLLNSNKLNTYVGLELDSSSHLKQKLITDHEHGQIGVVATQVDLRESSGSFANDDEDQDEESNGGDYSDGFFKLRRRVNGRYFRKNTNDAIKIISTPLGKVGIVYQQNATDFQGKNIETVDKKSSSFTDFDALSPDPESSHRLVSSHPKITPVLTADGKVALLYRGDSENSKYEPIRNLTTHKFNTIIDSGSDRKKLSSNNTDTSSEKSDVNLTENIGKYSDLKISDNSNIKNKIGIKLATAEQAAILPAPESIPTTGSFIIRPTDSVLPIINRPLSEVLGIKKNQFKQFRIKDTSITTERTSGSLAAVNFDNSESPNTLHYLTKVNLADYPSSSHTRNYDFDFSRDNTMLDERSRGDKERTKLEYKNKQQIGSINEEISEDVLSKTEVVNLAIVPHFDEELERLQRLREYEEKRLHRQQQKRNEEDLSGAHCVMQAMMGIAAISTVFGMLGTFFKQRILDQFRLMHW